MPRAFVVLILFFSGYRKKYAVFFILLYTMPKLYTKFHCKMTGFDMNAEY